MAFDIHGNELQKGRCEVHPWVAVEYPCPVCRREREHQRGTSKLSERVSELEAIITFHNETFSTAQTEYERKIRIMRQALNDICCGSADPVFLAKIARQAIEEINSKA